MLQWQLASFVHEAWGLANLGSLNSDAVNATSAETRDRTGDLQIFSLTLSQLSYRGHIISVGKGVILCKIPGVVLVSVSSRPQLDMQQGGLQAFDRRNTKT